MSDTVDALLTQQVETRSDALAVSDSTGAAWSFADLKRASDELAVVFAEKGVGAGDRIVVLSENCAVAVASLFAAWKIGAVIVPVNARQTKAEVQRIVSHATPALVAMTTEVSPDAAAHADWMGAMPHTGSYGKLSLSDHLGSDPYDDPTVAVLLYTTGTTGDPKGVMLTHDNLLFGGKASAKLRGMTRDDVIYGVLPITHIFGLASIVTAAMHTGTHVRMEPRFSAAKLYDALRDGVTLLSAVPQMHALLMQYTKEQGHSKLGSDVLRYVSSGAAPLDPAWKRKAESFYGVALQNGYGMTETTAGVCSSRSKIDTDDISCGPALPGVEVYIDETVEGGGDGAGEVVVRGPNVMSGYFRNPEETAKVLSADGWLKTGDLGRLDAHGHLHILGRSKELIIHGGFNVYPPEVEAALNDHPQVIQSAVIGHSVAGDEHVLAFVQVSEDDKPDPEELRSFVAERLTGYKRPKQVVLSSSLPAAPTGKILKHKLLETFAAQLDQV